MKADTVVEKDVALIAESGVQWYVPKGRPTGLIDDTRVQCTIQSQRVEDE